MTDKIREAFEAWDNHKTWAEGFTAGYQARDSELRAELEAAKKDAERLDWISKSTDSIEYVNVWAAWTDGSTLRDAIDQAINEKP